MCSNYPGIKLEPALFLRFWDNKAKLNICHHKATSSTQLQNRSFHVVERTWTSAKCEKINNARAKRAKLLFFVVKYANLWSSRYRRRRSRLSCLLFSGARFSKVPKCFGRISGDIILFVSSKQRRLEAVNIADILIFILFTTCEKTNFTEWTGRSFTNGSKILRDFRETGRCRLRCRWPSFSPLKQSFHVAGRNIQ